MRYLSQMLRSSLFLAALLAVALPACGAPARAPSPLRNDTATVASAGPSIRSIDWMNRVYTSGAGGQPYQVENGEYEYAYDEDGNLVAPDYQPADPDAFVERGYFSVTPPEFGDLTGDGAEEAVIVTLESTGGTGRFSGIDVYTMQGGKEVVLGGIPGGDRGDGGIAGVRIEGGVVVVDRMKSLDTDGACCPSRLVHERWTWNGAAFVEDEAARSEDDFAE